MNKKSKRLVDLEKRKLEVRDLALTHERLANDYWQEWLDYRKQIIMMKDEDRYENTEPNNS